MFQSLFPPQTSRRELFRAGLLAALGSTAVVEMVGATRAGASTKSAQATRISVVGDSLTEGTEPYQAASCASVGWARTSIDAWVSRGVRTKLKKDPHTGLSAVDAIRNSDGDSDLWVVALGTNDAGFYPRDTQLDVIREMVDHIGDGHYVLWVNVYLPATPERQHTWNSSLDTVAAERPEQLVILDWAKLVKDTPRWTAHDRIHCSTEGYKFRANAIALASKTLVPTKSSRPQTGTWPPMTKSMPL